MRSALVSALLCGIVSYAAAQGTPVTFEESQPGALTFVRVDTPHGPLEVAVSFGTDRTVRGVVVTKATVETKPWVVEALAAGLTDGYRGLRATDRPAARAGIKGRAGAMAAYIAQEIDKGVARALAAYGDFYLSKG